MTHDLTETEIASAFAWLSDRFENLDPRLLEQTPRPDEAQAIDLALSRRRYAAVRARVANRSPELTTALNSIGRGNV